MGKFLSLTYEPRWQYAEMDVNANIDPEFRGQPESDFELDVQNLRLSGLHSS